MPFKRLTPNSTQPTYKHFRRVSLVKRVLLPLCVVLALSLALIVFALRGVLYYIIHPDLITPLGGSEIYAKAAGIRGSEVINTAEGGQIVRYPCLFGMGAAEAVFASGGAFEYASVTFPPAELPVSTMRSGINAALDMLTVYFTQDQAKALAFICAYENAPALLEANTFDVDSDFGSVLCRAEFNGSILTLTLTYTPYEP